MLNFEIERLKKYYLVKCYICWIYNFKKSFWKASEVNWNGLGAYISYYITFEDWLDSGY